MTNAHAAWDALVELEKLTLDSAPAPGNYTVGGTLTGGSSGKTSVVVAVISSTVYLIKDRSGDYTDGEIISDGTNSRDCGAGYPQVTHENVLGLMGADTRIPVADRYKCLAVRKSAKTNQVLTKRALSMLGQALNKSGTNASGGALA